MTTPPKANRFFEKSAAQSADGNKTKGCEAMDQKVTVVSRLEWAAATPRNKETLSSSACRVIIHHTALTNYKGHREQLVSIQRLHMKERGFDDIGYNFLVGGDGTVYEGRGWGVVGAHSKGNNHDSVGIAFMGNFNYDTPSREAISSVKRLLQSGVSQGFLRPHFVLFGHRDLGNTECPGQKLYAALPQLRGTTILSLCSPSPIKALQAVHLMIMSSGCNLQNLLSTTQDMKSNIKQRKRSKRITSVEATMRAFCTARNIPNKCSLVQHRDYKGRPVSNEVRVRRERRMKSAQRAKCLLVSESLPPLHFGSAHLCSVGSVTRSSLLTGRL
ncbi:hypothetical protein PAMP_018830 [Pampus punctatissimus]